MGSGARRLEKLRRERQEENEIRTNMYVTLCIMSLALHNELGLGKHRLERVLQRYKLQLECINKQEVSGLTGQDILDWCQSIGITETIDKIINGK